MTELLPWFVAHGYPILFATLLLSGFGLPIPEDVPLIAAGIMADHGGMSVPMASLSLGVFVLIRDAIVFTFGYRYGQKFLDRPWPARVLRRELVDAATERIRKNGVLAVAVGRFLPGLRGAVFFAAGTAKVPPAQFMLVDTLAATVSLPLFIYIGYAFSSNYEAIGAMVERLRFVLLALAILAVLAVLLRSKLRRA
jgi:membrane protein DedA with SNARE-associated domain